MLDADKSQELIFTSLIIPIVKELITPKIKQVIKKYESPEINETKIESDFEHYLLQRYEKYLVVDTLVFPNQQTFLSILYEPLTLTTTELNKDVIDIKIDTYPPSFIPVFCRVLIEDTAGMGKSTLMKKLFLSAIETKSGIPILIELRQINMKNPILEEIQNQLSPIGGTFS